MRSLIYFSVHMKIPDTLGQFEQLVLAAVSTLDEAYGMTVHEKVEDLGKRQVKLGAVYSTLDRLEDKGYLSSRMTEPQAERGGRSKRCYKVEASGREALTESAQTASRIFEAVGLKWRKRLWNPGKS
jgi:PadR family transcriptional regulator, regulatory protein PadR